MRGCVLYYVVGAVVLVALVGLALLIRFISRGDARIGLWSVLLVLAVVIAAMLGQLASIYYRPPVGWIAVVVASVLVAAAVFWLIGRSVAWKAPRVLALVGLVLASLVTLTFTLIAVPLGGLFMPLFEARAQQIAEANGFDALLPTDLEMNLEAGLPVGETESGAGLAIGYDRFTLAERAAAGALDYEELEARMEPGEYPVGDVGPGSEIPEDAEYVELEVDGGPALGVSYRAVTEEKMDDLAGTDPVNVLIFERDRVEIVLYSQGFMEYQSDGSYQPRGALSFDELIEIAETLASIE